MSDARPQFPANVAIFLKREIARYSQYRAQSEVLEAYLGNDWYYKMQYESKKKQLEDAMQGLLFDIVAITRRHFPSIEVDANSSVTLSNILAALPPKEELVIKKVFQGDG